MYNSRRLVQAVAIRTTTTGGLCGCQSGGYGIDGCGLQDGFWRAAAWCAQVREHCTLLLQRELLT